VGDRGGSGDTNFWVAGLSLALYSLADAPTPPPPPPPPADTDHDGVNDPDDQCVNEAAGEHPDAARRGCPASDDDHDNVYGADDQCPDQAAGDHPDPARAGCALADTDGDGVFGSDDQCPDQAAGDHPNPERRGCPDADGDSDGVFDHGDQCPTEAAGIHPDPARAGCPAPDRDHDNIPDAQDHCPDRPGAPSSNPTRNGCPGLVVLENGALRILRPVQFAPNSDRILPASNALLNSVADALRSTPEIRRVAIEGHTDDVGDDAANMTLSQRRADSVVRWLTTTGRVEATRLTAQGFGESRPLAPGTTAAIRARNRRVEFRIVDVAH
jgi:outer membrane protein OmpA-like peptidoglycan-associated protein